jgi:hypothetical protein
MELNREILDCMKTLRRRLREEQALDIRLSQADAVGAMLAACLASSDENTRLLGQRLARCSDQPYDHSAAAERPDRASQRIYRGQRVRA